MAPLRLDSSQGVMDDDESDAEIPSGGGFSFFSRSNSVAPEEGSERRRKSSAMNLMSRSLSKEQLLSGASKFLPSFSMSSEQHLEQVQAELSGKRKPLLLDPRSKFMRGWDSITVLALLFTALVTPYEMAFLTTSSLDNVLFWVNRLVDSVFIVDMGMQFFLMYYDEQHDLWVRDKRKIAFGYLRGWFLLDLVSVMPFDVIGMLVGESQSISKLRAIRIMKLLRLVKLLRVLRIGRIFQRIEEALNISYKSLQLISFAGIVCICAHWMACALQLTTSGFNVCTVSNYENGLCTNWIYYYNENGGNGRLLMTDEDGHIMVKYSANPLAADEYDHPPALRYLSVYWAAIYWAAMTMSTIGYGDVIPQTDSERIYVVIGMCFGASIYAYMVGNVCNILASMAAGQEAFRQEMDSLNKFMVACYLPKDLRSKLRQFYRYRNSSLAIYDTMDIIATLSPFLRTEVADYTEVFWIKSSDMFEGFPSEMVINLCLSLIPEVFVPQEIVFTEGQKCDKLYITERGVVICNGKLYGRPTQAARSIAFRDNHKSADKNRRVPAWIGLRDMISYSGVYRYSATAIANSVLLSLSRDDLDLQLQKYPKAAKEFRRKMVRLLTKDMILQYSKAISFITNQTEESLMRVLFPGDSPDASTQLTDNWVLKQKFGQVLDLAVVKLGPLSPLTAIIKEARKSAITIQAAYRGMVARRKMNAEFELNHFLKNAGDNGNEDNFPLRSSIQEKVKWRAARAARSAKNSNTADVLSVATQSLILKQDQTKSSSSEPGPVTSTTAHQAFRPGMGPVAVEGSGTTQHPPLNDNVENRLAAGGSSGLSSSSMLLTGAAQTADEELVSKNVRMLRKHVNRLEDTFTNDMQDVKRMVREILARQHVSSSSTGGGTRKSAAMLKLQL